MNTKFAVSHSGDSILFETFRCYISNVSLEGDVKSELINLNLYHLIDLEDSNSLSIVFPISNMLKPKRIFFQIGVDSSTNSKGIGSGALDPIQGMYWTWQSGYIQFKIEGSFFRKEEEIKFEYHIGGYQWPNNTSEYIMSPLSNELGMQYSIDLSKFFLNLDIHQMNHVMSPGPKAKFLADLFAACFQIE